MTKRRRWVRGGFNGEATKPCEYAAAIRARADEEKAMPNDSMPTATGTDARKAAKL